MRQMLNITLISQFPYMCFLHFNQTGKLTLQPTKEIISLYMPATVVPKIGLCQKKKKLLLSILFDYILNLELAHQWILCSEWVPSEQESKQLKKTSTPLQFFN